MSTSNIDFYEIRKILVFLSFGFTSQLTIFQSHQEAASEFVFLLKVNSSSAAETQGSPSIFQALMGTGLKDLLIKYHHICICSTH